MPIFRLDTNISKEKITLEFMQSLAKVIAATLGKPEKAITVHVNPEQLMISGCDDKGDIPCGHGTLLSIGHLGIEENKIHSAAIFDHVEKVLGIPKNRWKIQFIDALPSEVGFNGSTLHPASGDT